MKIGEELIRQVRRKCRRATGDAQDREGDDDKNGGDGDGDGEEVEDKRIYHLDI